VIVRDYLTILDGRQDGLVWLSKFHEIYYMGLLILVLVLTMNLCESGTGFALRSNLIGGAWVWPSQLQRVDNATSSSAPTTRRRAWSVVLME